MRLDKFISNMGILSRRDCQKAAKCGDITVNGKIVKDPSVHIDENSDEICVCGKKISYEKHIYIIMNKPKGYVCTVKDDLGRKTVMDLLPHTASRVVPVGRLDYDSEGLLIFTNDGELVNRLTHPRNEVPKTYQLKVEGTVTEPMLNKLRTGVELDGVMTKKCNLHVLSVDDKFTKLSITITEGKNRQVRRMFEAVGKEVVFLKRTKIGELGLTGLDRGKCRQLTAREIDYLRNI